MPSRQGDLDSLCGFYSIVNMMYWLYGRKIKRKTLFKALLQCYSQHWSIIECLTSGMDSSQMNVLLQYLSQCRYRKYPVIISQPFSTPTSLSKLKILRTIRSYLENNDSRQLLCETSFTGQSLLMLIVRIYISSIVAVTGKNHLIDIPFVMKKESYSFIQMAFILLNVEM